MENLGGKNIEEYKSRLTNFSNEFDLGLFVYIVRKSLLWVAVIMAVAALAAFIYLRYTPIVYNARALIQLGQDNNANQIIDVTSIREDNSTDVKVEQLRSKLLISRTVERLPIRISYFAKGQILTNEHYKYTSYEVVLDTIRNQRVYDIAIPITFADSTTFSFTYGGFNIENQRVGQLIDAGDFAFTVHVLNGKSLLRNEEEYELLFKINSTHSLASRFASGLNIRIANNTAKTLEIAYKDNNALLAKDFVMAHAEEFIRYDLEKRMQSDEYVLTFLDSQIDTVFENLKASEVDLNAYKQANKVTDLDAVGKSYLDRLNYLENDIVSLDIEQRLLDEVEVLAKKSTSNIEVNSLVPLVAGSRYNATLSKLLDGLYDLMLRKESALYSITPENDRIKTLDYNINVQKSLILQSLKTLRQQINNSKQQLQEKVLELEGVYYNLPIKELEYARLQRLFSINEKYYTLLLEKAIEYRISKEGFVSTNQILEEARIPLEPVKPVKKIILFTFFMAGLLISLILVSVRYLLHNNITSLNEIVRLSNATISTIGIVPRFKEDIPVSMLLVDKSPRSLIAESFRSIRTNLQFIDNSEGSKMAAITSTISGEGKTFVSLNLAGIIAFSGKKVVVIDLDMRKPKIHKAFGVENQQGMSTILIGRHTIEECIRDTSLPNLQYITAGPVPPNPSELIIGESMMKVLAELKSVSTL
jgi:tyrosine-protein kinase Etk/Wzc